MKERKTIWPYIKGYKFNSLLFKNFAYVFMLVTLPLLLVLSLNYKKFNSVVNSRIMDMNEELLQKSAVVTDNIMDDILDVLFRMSRLDAVLEVVQQDAQDPTYAQNVRKAVSQVKTRVQTNNYIVSTYIYSDINEMLISRNGAAPIAGSADRGKWYDIHKEIPMDAPYVLVNHANSIFVCQPIWTKSGERAGLFVLDVELQKISELLENQELSGQGIFFVTDISGQTMYCNDSDFAGWDKDTIRQYEGDIAKVKAGQTLLVENRIISAVESIHKSWRYAFVTEMPDYQGEMEAVRSFLLSSVAVGMLSSLVVAYIITMLTFRPMRKIMNVIKNPQLHWNEKEATKKSNELLYITSNILADRNANKEISQEVEDRIRALRQAQFRALQFQIDPHFLYNTLETIKWAAVEDMGLGNRTSKMLTKVARLYRQGLENDDVIVTLREELEFLKLYIEIVRIRFGDSIAFHWDIDERLLDCNVIKMCLQPIVENAIHHGLRPKDYRGNITISATYRQRTLCVAVADDGQNVNPAQIRSLNEKLKTGAGFQENHVGLRNVNERIKLIYGRKYGVSIDLSQQEPLSGKEHPGLRVMLTFPCRNINRSEETK